MPDDEYTYPYLYFNHSCYLYYLYYPYHVCLSYPHGFYQFRRYIFIALYDLETLKRASAF